MRVLVIWPPHVPVYFNAGHRLITFSIAAYLRKLEHVAHVEALDAGVLNFTWREVANRLMDRRYDLIVLVNELGVPEAVIEMLRYVRAISPGAKTITCGRLSHEMPRLFKQHDFDAVVESGDCEAAVAAYTRHVAGLQTPLAGVSIREGATWRAPDPAEFMDLNDLPFPDISEIPYEAYDRLYKDDSNKYCGIPQRRELVVPVARGCPVNCEFCDIPRQQGLRERRRSVSSVISFIEESFRQAPFEYASMYAPTFTLNKRWVEEFCNQLLARDQRYPWKCVTTMHHLEAGLLQLMGRSGCVRVSIGLETLQPEAQSTLPKLKHKSDAQLQELGRACKAAGIELNCFVVLGLPGQTIEAARYTVERVRECGARVRPTIYTPYTNLAAETDVEAARRADRLFFITGATPPNPADFYRLAIGTESRPTQVMEQIPRVEAGAYRGT